MAPVSSLAELHAQLRGQRLPFLLLSTLTSAPVRVQFAGNYEATEVLWNATIVALRAPQQSGSRQFIDIGAIGPHGQQISIGLKLPHIDTAAILKTVTMVRNYKRLRPGRIEWG